MTPFAGHVLDRSYKISSFFHRTNRWKFTAFLSNHFPPSFQRFSNCCSSSREWELLQFIDQTQENVLISISINVQWRTKLLVELLLAIVYVDMVCRYNQYGGTTLLFGCALSGNFRFYVVIMWFLLLGNYQLIQY